MMGRKQDEIARLSAEIAALRRGLENQKAQDVGAYRRAHDEIVALSKKTMTGSGLIIQARHLSGAVALSPILISDGFSPEFFQALAGDIRASHSMRLVVNQLRDLPRYLD